MRYLLVVMGLVIAVVLRYLWMSQPQPHKPVTMGEITIPDELQRAMDSSGPPEIVMVTDQIYTAVGYAFATVTMLVGDEGTVIVDTTDNMVSGKAVVDGFKQLTDKPTKVIIYTHHHVDHVSGAKAFVSDGFPAPEVWAHENVAKETRAQQMVGPAYARRAAFQFGAYIDEPQVSTGGSSTKGLFNTDNIKLLGNLRPTKLLNGDLNVTIVGLQLVILHIPGETSYQIGVWHSDSRTLIAADDIARAFPNLYTISGSSQRHIIAWINSLDRMIKLRPRCLISGHSRPVCGEDSVNDILTEYKAAISYVHDQTVRYINKGIHPDEIANTVTLPDTLSKNPFLWQVYGTVPWSAKGIFDMYMGWFSGDAVDLNPLSPKEKASRMIELVGEKYLLEVAETALVEGDYQWSLELATHVFVNDRKNAKAVELRRSSLRELAGQMASTNGRHYLATAILDDVGQVPRQSFHDYMRHGTVEVILQSFRYRVKAESIPTGETLTGCFHFTDTKKTACIRIVHAVLEVMFNELDPWTFKVHSTEDIFRDAIISTRSAFLYDALTSRNVAIEGKMTDLDKLWSYIDLS